MVEDGYDSNTWTDNSKCSGLSHRMPVGAIPIRGSLWEEQVEGIMIPVTDIVCLKCPLVTQMEAFLRLGLQLLTFKTIPSNKITCK